MKWTEVYGIKAEPQEMEEVQLNMRKTPGAVARKRRGKKHGYIIVLKSWPTNTEVRIMLFLYSRFHICVLHRRKMKAIRRSLKKYLEKKLEELMGMTDEKAKDDLGIR